MSDAALVCWWCHADKISRPSTTRDHLIPQWARLILGRYQLKVPYSLLKRVRCCRHCNSAKGAMPPELFAKNRHNELVLKGLGREWSRLSHLLGGSWNGVLREVDPEAVTELHRAMCASFLHDGINYPIEGDKARIPSQAYTVIARASVIRIDVKTLSHQPAVDAD